MSDFTKEELTEAFNMCDVDGNGAITCAELAGLFEHAAKGAGKEAEYPKAKCEEIAQVSLLHQSWVLFFFVRVSGGGQN